MSQDVSTNQRGTKPLTAPTLLQPWSAEADADQLMNDLFADIDRILEGGSKLPTEPVKPEYVSLQSIVIPPITVSPAAIAPLELSEVSSVASDTAVESRSPTTTTQSTSSAPKRSSWYTDKFLLLAVILMGAVVLGLLWAIQKNLTWPWSRNFAAAPSPENGQISEADAQFINYVKQALVNIDRKTETKQKTAMIPGISGSSAANTSVLPLPVSGNRSLGSNLPPTYIDKYIVNNNYTTYPIQTPSIPPKNSSAASRTTPAPASQPAPALSVLPAAIPTPPQSSIPTPPPPALNIPPLAVPSASTPVVQHTLVGLLEQGEGSAALFQIDGITQRINIGEGIGGSGWTLVSVGNKEAMIRRNGEVRSIYVGQTF